MNYMKGQLYIERTRSCQGAYKCVFQTRDYEYVGYTNDSEVYDYFAGDDAQLYLYGVTSTIGYSKELVHRAWRMAYNIAKSGKRTRR